MVSGNRAVRWVLVGLLAATVGGSARGENKKVLMVTKSQGFQHSVVRREKDGSLGLAEQTVVDLGKKHGFDVTVTKDGREVNAENLKNYDAVLFFTQGELDVDNPNVDQQPPMRSEDRQSILDFVNAGGGFVGTHCGGADTFHKWEEEGGKKPFLEMVGGEFIGHGPQQVSTIEVVDKDFPAVSHWKSPLPVNDEWYAYRGFGPNMRVLMLLHTDGMEGHLGLYRRPNYPITWCSQYGKGRVFYTGLGHREDVWTNPDYQQMVAQAVLWSLGQTDGDATPNLKELFGSEQAALERINPPKAK